MLPCDPLRDHPRVAALALSAVVATVAIPSAHAAAQWSAMDGPYGEPVVSVAVDPATSDVYLAQQQDVLRSTDGGQTWTSIVATAGLSNVLSLTVTSDRVLVGVSLRGVYWTTDGGASWDSDQLTRDGHTGFGSSVVGVGVTPQGTYYANNFRSTNGGASWIEMSVFGRAFAFLSDGTSLAGTFQGVHRSTNQGASWTPINAGIEDQRISWLVVDDADAIFAATQDDGVFRSTNGGASWLAINDGLPSLAIRGLALDADGDLVVGTLEDGVYTSSDGGASWDPAGVPPARLRTVVAAPDGALYAGSTSIGVHASLDGGATWVDRNQGLHAQYLRDGVFVSGGASLVSGGSTTFRSTDDGQSWTPALDGAYSPAAFDLARTADGNVYAATGDGVFVTPDGGLTWTRAGDDLIGAPVHGVAIAPDGSLYAYSEVASTAGGHLFRSTDDGASWEVVLEDADFSIGAFVDASAVDAAGRVYAGGMSFLVEPIVMVSTDGGTTWTETTLPGDANAVTDLERDGAGILAADGVDLFRTDDGGVTWTPLATGPWSAIADLTVGPDGVLFVATPTNGVYRSDDGGATWSGFSEGLPPGDFGLHPNIVALATSDTHLFAMTTGQGVHRTPIEEVVSVVGPGAVTGPVVSAAPNPFRTRTLLLRGDVPEGVPVRADIYDVSGRHVRAITSSRGPLHWDGRDAVARRVAPGTYLVRVQVGDEVASEHVTLLP